MAINFRLITIGGLISFIGTMFYKIGVSHWVQENLPWLSSAFSGAVVLLQIVVLTGAVIIAFGIFWGRWILAVIFGILFAVGIYTLSFVL